MSPANPDEGGPIPALSHYPPAVQEVLKQEGMFPLQYTPEVQPPTSSSFDPNSTIDIGHNEDPSGGNATVILSPEPPGLTTLRALRANNGNELAKRYCVLQKRRHLYELGSFDFAGVNKFLPNWFLGWRSHLC